MKCVIHIVVWVFLFCVGSPPDAHGKETEKKAENAASESSAPSTPEEASKRIEAMAMEIRDMVKFDSSRFDQIAAEMGRLGQDSREQLLDLLTDPVPHVRAAALTALGCVADEETLPSLIARLGDEEPLVVKAAVASVARFDGDWPIESLVRWLAHPDEDVNGAILDALDKKSSKRVDRILRHHLEHPPLDVGLGPFLAALGRFPDRRTKKKLLAALDDTSLTPWALRGLSHMGPKLSGKLAKWVLKVSKSRADVATQGVDMLIGFGDKGLKALYGILPKLPLDLKRHAVKTMIAKDEDGGVKRLGKLTSVKSGELRLAALELIPQTKGANARSNASSNLRHKDTQVRMLAGRALAGVGRDVAVERLLIARYREVSRKRAPGNVDERTMLLDALGKVGNNEAVAVLAQAFGYRDEAKPALTALGRLGQVAIPTLLFVIKTGDPVRTPLAVTALAEAGPVALEPLMKLLSHRDRTVRNVARKAVAKIGITDVVPRIVKLIKLPRTPGRLQLLPLLGALYCPASLEALTQFTKDEQKKVRLMTVNVLSKIAAPEVLPILMAVAEKDREIDIRHLAVKGLIWQGHEGAVELFVNMMGDEKDSVRKTVAMGLGYLAKPEHVDAILPKMSTPRGEILTALRHTLRRILFRSDLREAEDFESAADSWLSKTWDVKPLEKRLMAFADGSTVDYWMHGDGPPLLVVPDGPDYRHDYLRPALDAFFNDHLVIYVDLPGRGNTRLPNEGAAVAGLEHDVQILATLLARLNLRNVDVYGHGFGAMTAARLAEKYGKVINRVILDNSPVPFLLGWRTRVKMASQSVPSPWREDLQIFSSAESKFQPHVRDKWLTLALLTGSLSKPAVILNVLSRLHTDPRLRRTLLEPMGDFSYLKVYEELKKPTFMLYGEASPISANGRSWRDRVVSSNANLSIQLLEETGHWPFYENNDAWMEAMRGILD